MREGEGALWGGLGDSGGVWTLSPRATEGPCATARVGSYRLIGWLWGADTPDAASERGGAGASERGGAGAADPGALGRLIRERWAAGSAGCEGAGGLSIPLVALRRTPRGCLGTAGRT